MNLKYLTICSLIILFNFSSLQAQSAKVLLQNMDLLIAAPKDKEASVLMLITDKSGKEKKKRSFSKAKREIQKII